MMQLKKGGDNPLYQIRMALAGRDKGLAVQLQAAQRRANAVTGKAFTVTALYNAERNGAEARTSTIADWAKAWGFHIVIAACRQGGREVSRFGLAVLPDGLTWKAMAAMLEAMSLEMNVWLVPVEQTAAQSA